MSIVELGQCPNDHSKAILGSTKALRYMVRGPQDVPLSHPLSAILVSVCTAHIGTRSCTVELL